MVSPENAMSEEAHDYSSATKLFEVLYEWILSHATSRFIENKIKSPLS